MIIDDYGCFNPLVDGAEVTIRTKDLNIGNIEDYQSNLKDMVFDYIDNELFKKSTIRFEFENGMSARVNTTYGLINLLMWTSIIKTKQKIQPKHLFFRRKGITNKYIKEYLDKFPILYTRENLENTNSKMVLYDLNRIIDDTLRGLKFVDKMAWYFNNSINLEDFILMYHNCPGFKEIIDRQDTDYYMNLPVESVNTEALNDMNKLIEYIIDAKKYIGRDHCLSDTFRAGVGVKPKQAREVFTCIGIKPDGKGSIYHYLNHNNYVNGGANNVEFHMLESLVARIAQILSKKNTAYSGAFSRLLNLNCSTSRKYTKKGTDEIDPEYDCHTRNFIEYKVTNENKLKKIADRYYRLSPDGMEYKLGNPYEVLKKNKDLIGKTIYLRSPITCKSAAEGRGVCRKCMGEMYLIMKCVNIGIYCVTILTEVLTQMMLSAKHLLEAKLSKIKFDTDIDITKFIYLTEGTIYLNTDIPDVNSWALKLNIEDIADEVLASMGDDEEIDDERIDITDEVKYINVFHLVNLETGEVVPVKTTDMHNMYLTEFMYEFIYGKGQEEEEIIVPISELANSPLFNIGINNDDMSARLEAIVQILDLKANITSYDKNTFLETLSDKLDDIGLSHIMSVHLEVIIMNQIRDKYNILNQPDWDIPNQNDYQILTLKNSLMNHPCVTVSLQSTNIAKMLYNPVTFKKRKASPYDLLYHTQPVKYINEDVVEQTNNNPLFKYVGEQ